MGLQLLIRVQDGTCCTTFHASMRRPQCARTHTHTSPQWDNARTRKPQQLAARHACARARRVDASTSQQQTLGAHTAPVKCVEWLESKGVVVTASWDMTMRLWDPRSPPPSCNVATAELPGKAYTVGVGGQHLVVGTSARHVWIYDIARCAPNPAAAYDVFQLA